MTRFAAAAAPSFRHDAGESIVFKLIPWIIIGVFLAGVGLALYLRARNPERYRMIGRIVYEDTMERPDADSAVGPAGS